jgi:hypothetical protein
MDLLSSTPVFILLTLAGLITFSRYLVVAVKKLYEVSLTKKGEAALRVGTFLVCAAILLIVLLRR